MVPRRDRRDQTRAELTTALKNVRAKIKKLRIDSWLDVEAQERTLNLKVDETELAKRSELDGCYVLKTDLPAETADKQIIHDRYKDLAKVERAFRTCKQEHLEMRPVYVRIKQSTRGHILVVMLAYLVVREMRRAWSPFNLTVQEGLRDLMTLSTRICRLGAYKSPHPDKVTAAISVGNTTLTEFEKSGTENVRL